MTKIAVVGCGPTCLYLLERLIEAPAPLDITLLDAGEEPGAGMPYAQAWNTDEMLCNAFSREIPPLAETLAHWLARQPRRVLSEWELDPRDVNARAFYPRTLIGAWLRDQLRLLCARARGAGHGVTLRSGTRVRDILPANDGVRLDLETPSGPASLQVDHAVLATGHAWPEAPELDGVALRSPWPAASLAKLPPVRIGVLGSSLSAIDVLVALGTAHGRFEETGGSVVWHPGPGAEGLRIAMVSRTGVMPEADFAYPFPYRPLRRLTDEALDAEIAAGPEGLLDRAFALLIAELEAEAPDWTAALEGTARSVEGFGPAWFAQRRAAGGLEAVAEGLAETRAAMVRGETIPHRYAMLRGHEAFDRVLRHLNEADWERLRTHLLPVFADCYAAVPHLSLARVIALHQAGVLSLHATGEAGLQRLPGGALRVATEDGDAVEVDLMVDARGQTAATLAALPFPTLVAALAAAERPVVAPFRLSSVDGPLPVHCLSLPQLLECHPFSQGLAGVAELARVVADDLIANLRVDDLPESM